ncbi:palindromic element RPE1 domain-containing protein [Candidatus Tisiphia endosymbiont of Oplodontha viridula]|uniref:palindromic element RPE1 domain-containing protein n=1 Tax=Candidatus Tisiphia endosymbiont of Oplodontha viridula TaxID=3077925 RepID=UPI0035C89F04
MATKKLKHDEVVKAATESRPAADDDVREDSSTASTYKSPAEVEFRKKSNELTLITGLIPFPKTNHHVVVLYDLHSSRTSCTRR